MRALTLLLVFVFSGCASSGLFSYGILGTWRGEVTEGDQRYGLTMTLDRLDATEVAGTTAYSGAFDCGGTLTLLGNIGGSLVFRETIDDPTQCADGGRIVVERQDDDQLLWQWYRSDTETTPDATATLVRAE